MREICKQTGADIKSWTDKRHSARPTRMFVIEVSLLAPGETSTCVHCILLSSKLGKSVSLKGPCRAVTLALGIICDAIDRYKELCEGAYCGKFAALALPLRSATPCM